MVDLVDDENVLKAAQSIWSMAAPTEQIYA
jgi:hypothetical protein